MEYIQFHPTALACDEDPLPLISEAVRGHGALLINRNGRRFMPDWHILAELAPRDVVARAIFDHEQQGQRVFLDATAMGHGFAERFPSIFQACQKRGTDPCRQPIPVTPAAHFLMGGIKSDLNGASTLSGLFVCGESACTGVHGANRLASNSLLEGLVFGHRVAKSLSTCPELGNGFVQGREMALSQVEALLPWERSLENCLPGLHDAAKTQALIKKLRQIMWNHAGLARNARGLIRALDLIAQLDARAPQGAQELADMISVSRLVVRAALARRESRGSHFREDYPFQRNLLASPQNLSQGASP